VLGTLYIDGIRVRRNYAEAFRWSALAAQQGDVVSQYQLALLYYNGHGVAQNYNEAFKWYKLSAKQGFANAQNNLGVMYGFGLGVAQNFVKAHMWFNLAAAYGASEAIEGRNKFAELMTQQQIAQAQALASKCQASNYKDCD
jgi:hypothetical protein